MEKQESKEISNISNWELFLDIFSRIRVIREHQIKLFGLLLVFIGYILAEPYIYMRVVDQLTA
jgi:hypothetical protein